MRSLLLGIALGTLVTWPATAEPKYVLRKISSLRECRNEYRTLTGDWEHHPWFVRTRLSGGREHVLNCLPDGVEECVCNPVGGKLAVAIAPGETEAACRGSTPTLPIRPAMLPG